MGSFLQTVLIPLSETFLHQNIWGKAIWGMSAARAVSALLSNMMHSFEQKANCPLWKSTNILRWRE